MIVEPLSKMTSQTALVVKNIFRKVFGSDSLFHLSRKVHFVDLKELVDVLVTVVIRKIKGKSKRCVIKNIKFVILWI